MSGDTQEAWSRGDWMQTYTGRRFYPLDPRSDEIDPADIAHALSLLCRYGGHVDRFYSVAEHCVLMSEWVSLGWHASRNTHAGHGYGKDVVVYGVAFTPFERNPFRLVAHKHAAADGRIAGTSLARRRMVQSVELIESVPTQCISVGGDHTFLCGDQMVPTHNTGKGVYGEHSLQLMAYLMADFVGADDVVDERLTGLLHQATGMAVLHLADDGWEFRGMRPDSGTWDAFRGLLTFAMWMRSHEKADSVTTAHRKGAAAA